MHYICNDCGAIFDEEEAVHAAELAWYRGREAGDHVCPECGAAEGALDEYI